MSCLIMVWGIFMLKVFFIDNLDFNLIWLLFFFIKLRALDTWTATFVITSIFAWLWELACKQRSFYVNLFYFTILPWLFDYLTSRTDSSFKIWINFLFRWIYSFYLLRYLAVKNSYYTVLQTWNFRWSSLNQV